MKDAIVCVYFRERRKLVALRGDLQENRLRGGAWAPCQFLVFSSKKWLLFERENVFSDSLIECQKARQPCLKFYFRGAGL